MRTIAIFMAGVAVSTLAAPSLRAQAAAVDRQWAEQFIGSWDLTLQTPDGETPLVVTVREEGGQVVVALGNGQGESPPITDVTRNAEALVAVYEMDYQGTPIDATLRLQRMGDGLHTEWSFAGGSYTTAAHATRQ